ncbi:MAG: ABC transporter substrate-binding protein [Acidimicrobiales bacterium]
MNRRWIVITTVLVTFGTLAVACSDSSEKAGSDTTGPTTASPTTTAKAPQVGGTLVFGAFLQPLGLDPIVAIGGGNIGGTEMAAIYDTLIRFDTTTAKYEPQTAESLAPNADFTEWTLKLKQTIKFSDGTAYDAAAVVFGLNRHRSGLPGAPPCQEIVACPRNSQGTVSFMALVKDIQAIDQYTVKITLNEAWSGFPYALTTEVGMIPSPTALRKCDATKNPNTCDFNLKPVGAGPFLVDSFKDKDSINLVRNPNYWGGQVFLDGIKFVSFTDAGGSKTYASYKTGQLQVAFLGVPTTVIEAHGDKATGYSAFQQAGTALMLNTGVSVNCAAGKPEPVCTGKADGPTATNPATKDIRVRQAFAAAIDTSVLNARAYEGKAMHGSQMMQSDFRWFPDVAGPKYDPGAARKLVGEAKTAGWDGKLRLDYPNTTTGQALGIATQTMLQAVGIDAQLDTSRDAATIANGVIVNKNFDVVGWGLALTPDDGALVALTSNLSSTSGANFSGYKNAAVDQAIKDLRKASNDDQKKAAFKIIAEQVAIDVPFLPIFKLENFIVWSGKVHGVVPTSRVVVLWDKVWMEK